MENNQEHKIDKIFKNSFDNQSVTPPADAWMAVHTYTIGQEESKKRVWLRYASLALLVLLFSGLGLWNSLNLDSPDLRISGLKEESKIQKSINQQRTSFHNPNSDGISSNNVESIIITSKSNKKIHKSFNLANPNSDIFSHELLMENTKNSGMSNKKIHKSINLTNPNSDDFSHELLVKNINNSKNEDNAGSILNPDSIENFAYSNDNIISPNSEKQIENIESKPLIFNDLSKKMQKESEKKIVMLEENIVDKKAVNKADSVVYGKRFSLKHPLLKVSYGYSWNEWTNKLNSNSTIPSSNTYNSYGSFFKLGTAWDLNRKSRIEFNIGIYNSGNMDYGNQVTYWGNSKGDIKKLTLKQIGSDFYYEAGTPFGNINVPVYSFYESGFNINPNNPISEVSVKFQEPQSFNYIQSEINFENDLIQIKKIDKSIFKLYTITGITMQRVINYNYNANYSGLAYDVTNLKFPPKTWPPNVKYSDDNLQNAADIVLGLKLGVGLNLKFAKKWSLIIEGSGQTNINSWVKNQTYLTKQSSYLLQSGIQFSL